MEDPGRFLFLFLKAAPCSCRCRHCDFAVSGAFPPLPLERAISFVEPLLTVRGDPNAPFANLAVFWGDGPLNHPSLAAGMRYLRAHDIEGWYSLAANGFHFRPRARWEPYLQELRAAGTGILEFTLFGRDATHDWFALRPGDYAAILDLADLWEQGGGETTWSVFAHKRNLGELAELRTHLGPRAERCRVGLWAHVGLAADPAQEDLRLDAEDLSRLDAADVAELGDVRPEGVWAAELIGSDANPHPARARVLHLTVDGDGRASIPYKGGMHSGHTGALQIGRLPQESAVVMLENWERAYSRWREAYPSLGWLAEHCADRNGSKLHSRDSVIQKWCSRWEQARPACVPVPGATR